MEAAINRIMSTYGMLVNMSLVEEKSARERVTAFLSEVTTGDESQLAIEGLKFLRNGKPARRRSRTPDASTEADRNS